MDGHIPQLGLIANIYDSKTKQDLGKIIIEEEDKKQPISVYDDNLHRNIRVCLLGTLHFQQVFLAKEYVYKYLVVRTVNGEDQANIIYSPLNLIALNHKDVETEFIINHLLSEETIDGSELNYGYIGGIDRDKGRKFYIRN